jgi:vanillate/3-O-methylgallate O-demethylase
MTTAPSPFSRPSALPFYPEHGLYNLRMGLPRAWEFNGWKPESLSWKKACYIHSGLSGPGQMVFRGPEAEKFLASLCVNNFSKFAVGTAKHAVMCTETGLIAAHGVLQRLATDAFRLYACGPWPLYRHGKGSFDCEAKVENNYLTQVAGPTSLQTLEAACGESLRDIKFLRYRNTTIAGKAVEVMRIGMAGSLAYELHGPIADSPEVYDAVFEAGRQFGIERLGWKTYFVNHVEGGFPQATWTFCSAAYEDPDYVEFIGADAARWPIVSGSVDPKDARARYRTPVEVGWERSTTISSAALRWRRKSRSRNAPSSRWCGSRKT